MASRRPPVGQRRRPPRRPAAAAEHGRGPRRRAGRGPSGGARAAGRPAPADQGGVDRRGGGDERRSCARSTTWPPRPGSRCGGSPGAGSTPRPAPRPPRGCWPGPSRCAEADLERPGRRPGRRAALPPRPRRRDRPPQPGRAAALGRGAGVTGVVLPRHRAAHVTPTVAKAAAGAIEHLPMALVRRASPPPWPSSAGPGVWTVGLDADGDKRLVRPRPGRSARRPGARGRGRACPGWRAQRCDVVAAIPLPGPSSRSTWPPRGRRLLRRLPRPSGV